MEEFEEYRPPRRTQFELMLGRDERHEILEDEWEIPQTEIANAIRMNIKAKSQRLRTLNNIGRVSEMEEKLENVKRKLKRGVPWKKRPSKEAEDLAKASSVVKQAASKQPLPASVKKTGERRRKSEGYIEYSTA